jgi:hypothetical protein
MISRIQLSNFKTFEALDIEVGPVTLLIGPNNTGKTTVLQALTLWDIALRKWWDQKALSSAKKRTGVTINRQDLFAIPIPEARLLWYNLHTRSSTTSNINVFMTMRLEGITENRQWHAELEFYYANPESLYARPARGEDDPENLKLALKESFSYLPPMSGLSSSEERLEEGSIKRRIGEGRTAEVLRNLLWKIYNKEETKWKDLTSAIKKHFDTEVLPPEYNPATSLISCHIKESGKPEMDLTASGRGFQQALLLFSFLHSQPYTVLLLDEPDAHLEILRQKSLYMALASEVKAKNSQMLIATHSEAILDLASQNDTIIAFIGRPHQSKKSSELKKALIEIPYSDYLAAEQAGTVLYLEGSTDLEFLRAFAEVLQHPVREKLERPFVKYLNGNDMDYVRSNFNGLKEALPNLRGLILTDNLQRIHEMPQGLVHVQWKRNEIECYLPLPHVLERYIAGATPDSPSLFETQTMDRLKRIIADQTPPAALRNMQDDFWKETKISDKWLSTVLKKYYAELGLPVQINKGDYFLFAQYARPEELDEEIIEKLDILNDFLA